MELLNLNHHPHALAIVVMMTMAGLGAWAASAFALVLYRAVKYGGDGSLPNDNERAKRSPIGN